MTHRFPLRILAASAAVALVLTAVLGWAPALAEDDEPSRAARLEKVMDGVTVTLDKAVATAAAKVSGRAVAAHFEMDDGKPVFEVLLLARVKVGEVEMASFVEVEIDAKSGAVLETEILGADGEDDEEYGEDDDDEDGDDEDRKERDAGERERSADDDAR